MAAKSGSNSSKLNFSEVDVLVQELTKENPDETRVAALMTNVGLPYQSDPVLRMSHLLDVLNGDKKITKQTELDSHSNGRDREEGL